MLLQLLAKGVEHFSIVAASGAVMLEHLDDALTNAFVSDDFTFEVLPAYGFHVSFLAHLA